MEGKRFAEANLGPTKTARQHVAPRFYLSNFAVDGAISVMDVTNGQGFTAAVQNVAVIKGFYDIHIGGWKVSLESWLAEVEGKAAPILDKLRESPEHATKLGAEQERALSRFLAAQTLRVPAFREWEIVKRGEVVEGIKSIAKSFLEKNEPPDVAANLWEHWNSQPEWWWLQEPGPSQDAELTAAMLSELEGWGNIFRALPWRAGKVSGATLYTSDNPVSGRLPAVRPWWAGGAIWEKSYFFAVSPEVLLQMGPLGYDGTVRRRGPRLLRDFSEWETTYARHVITDDATRFVYGPPPYLTRECATACLTRIDDSKFWDAIVLQGFRPGPPAYRLSPQVRLMIGAIEWSLAARGKSRPTLTKFKPPPTPAPRPDLKER